MVGAVATEDQAGTGELSERELEVVALVIEGQTNKEIARGLQLSVHTVQHHVASARRKTRARSRTHLAVLVMRAGLVPLDPPSSRKRHAPK